MKHSLFLLIMITTLDHIVAQQFSSDIIIDSTYSNINFRSFATLNIDSDNNLGIAWTDFLNDGNDIIYFIRSTDGGNTFSNKAIVEGDSIDPVDELRGSSAVFFDTQNNPLVFYKHGYYPYYIYHRIKKSFNNGITFQDNPTLNVLSDREFVFGSLWNNDTLNFICVEDFATTEIILIKTYDEGLTFIDSVLINTGENSPIGIISLVKLKNGNYFVFWDGQDINTHRNSVYFNRSTDNGNSFSNYIEIDSVSFSPNRIYGVSSDNNIFLIYYRKFGSVYQLLFKKSLDGGETFSDFDIIFELPVTSTPTSPEPYLFYKKNIGLCLLFNSANSDNRVLYFMRSKDLGLTFDSVVVVNTNSISGYNSMAISDSGDVYVVSVKDSTNYLILNKAKLDLVTSVIEDFDIINSYQLYQNFPNPFNPTTTVKYQIPEEGIVFLKIYDILGKEIKTLVNEHKPMGRYEISFDASNLASGIYIYRIQVNDYISSKKMMVLK